MSQSSAIPYQAPHHRSDPENIIPGVYMVMFHAGHTVEKHFAFLGRKFDLTTLPRGYFANMDDQLLDAIRRDPGVKLVEDDSYGEDEGE